MQIVRRPSTWRAIAIAMVVVFLAAAVLGRASQIGRHHVVVDVYNIDNYAQVFVNCVQHRRMLQDGDRATLDLGWLPPQDLITLQARNREGSYSWGFKLRVDGRVIAVDARGTAGPDGVGADNGRVGYEHGITHRRTYNAAGYLVGDFGCQGSGSLLAGRRDTASNVETSWRPPDTAYALAATLRRALTVVLILLGLLAVLWLVAEIHTSAPNAPLALVPIVAFVAQGGDPFVLKCYGVAAVALLIFPVGEAGIVSRIQKRLRRSKPLDTPDAPTTDVPTHRVGLQGEAPADPPDSGATRPVATAHTPDPD